MLIKINNALIELKRGDITEEDTDAIVNAANSRLAGGGGVDGAIHSAGGPRIMEECGKIGGCETGCAVITGAGRLKARHVIHAVGPIYKDGSRNEETHLKSAYAESLRLAQENGLKTIAFPSISTGAYGYPVEEASVVALSAIMEHLKERGGISLVRMVLFSDRDFKAYKNALERLLKEQVSIILE